VRAIMYRLSIPGMPRKSNLVYAVPNSLGTSPLIQFPLLSQGTSDIPNTSLKATLFSAQGQARNMYIGGLPDALIRTGVPIGPDMGATGLTGFQGLWNSWLTLLLSGQWGFRALALLPAGQPGPISFWQQAIAAPFNLQFILPNAAVYQPSVGDIVHIRGVLMGVTGAPRPIGRWRIRSKTAFDANNSVYELDQSSGYQAVLIDQPGTVESTTTAYVAYQTMGNMLQTSRRRGIGPVRPRGRSKPRARRQPA